MEQREVQVKSEHPNLSRAMRAIQADPEKVGVVDLNDQVVVLDLVRTHNQQPLTANQLENALKKMVPEDLKDVDLTEDLTGVNQEIAAINQRMRDAILEGVVLEDEDHLRRHQEELLNQVTRQEDLKQIYRRQEWVLRSFMVSIPNCSEYFLNLGYPLRRIKKKEW